jgi:small multidrug resistance pump
MAAGLNPWMLLAIAIGLEVTGTLLLKLSDGFAKLHWGLLAIFLYAVCFWALSTVLKAIPVGVAYAIWAGVGIVAIAAISFLAFDERLGPSQIVYMILVIIGAAGLQLTTK